METKSTSVKCGLIRVKFILTICILWDMLFSMKYKLRSTERYDKWFSKLKDASIKAKILARLDRVENGNFGDFKQISSKLFELRFFFGGGLRAYYTIQDGIVVFLLAGGDKSSQTKDIEKAAKLLDELEA